MEFARIKKHPKINWSALHVCTTSRSYVGSANQDPLSKRLLEACVLSAQLNTKRSISVLSVMLGKQKVTIAALLNVVGTSSKIRIGKLVMCVSNAAKTLQ